MEHSLTGSRGGGRGTMDNGKKGQMKDQDLTDAKYRAFKTAMENGTPIPCIIGMCPSSCSHSYSQHPSSLVVLQEIEMS